MRARRTSRVKWKGCSRKKDSDGRNLSSEDARPELGNNAAVERDYSRVFMHLYTHRGRCGTKYNKAICLMVL